MISVLASADSEQLNANIGDWAGIPTAVWIALITFVLSNVVAIAIRVIDHKRTVRSKRISAVVDFLDACRQLIDIERERPESRAERMTAEGNAHRALLELSIRGVGDLIVNEWAVHVLEAIRFNPKWQNPDVLSTSLSEPLMNWIDNPQVKDWFAARINAPKFDPVQFVSDQREGSSWPSRAYAYCRRNLPTGP